jgi:hypothetical protein
MSGGVRFAVAGKAGILQAAGAAARHDRRNTARAASDVAA